MLGLSYASSLSPRLESKLATLFTSSPSRVGHPGDPYKLYINPTPNSETVSVMPVHSDVWPSTLETQTTLGI